MMCFLTDPVATSCTVTVDTTLLLSGATVSVWEAVGAMGCGSVLVAMETLVVVWVPLADWTASEPLGRPLFSRACRKISDPSASFYKGVIFTFYWVMRTKCIKSCKTMSDETKVKPLDKIIYQISSHL